MDISYEDVVQFLFREAALLDQREYEAWLALLDEGIRYRMPVRVTRDFGESDDFIDDMTFFDETKRSLQTRVERFRTTSAWSENPPTRTRHIVSNIRVVNRERPDAVQVASYFLILRSIRDSSESAHIFGERVDTIHRVDGQLKLAERTIYLDQTVFPMLNLSIFI